MQILLTNDDGIFSPGIMALHQQLKKIGKVTVVAPEREQSSVSHGITLLHPLWITEVHRKGGFSGFSITGTPADCVKFGVRIILQKKPDLVVSGINLGPNDGCSAFYSGTVAGAREGALLGIPSVAISLASFIKPRFETAASIGAKIAKRILQQKVPFGTFFNVNVPNTSMAAIKGIRVTKQGTVPIHGSFVKRVDPMGRTYYWMSGSSPMVAKDLDIDTYALTHRFVTITPLHCDLTDHQFRNESKSWNL